MRTKDRGKEQHIQIQEAHGWFYLVWGTSFRSVQDLIKYYKGKAITTSTTVVVAVLVVVLTAATVTYNTGRFSTTLCIVERPSQPVQFGERSSYSRTRRWSRTAAV